MKEPIRIITLENETKLLSNLKLDISQEIDVMTQNRGRKLVQEARVMVFPRWDLSVALVFDSFVHSEEKEHKLTVEGV